MTTNSSATALQETPHPTNNLTNSTNNSASSSNNPTSSGETIDGPIQDPSINHLTRPVEGDRDNSVKNTASQRPISRTIKRRAQALIRSRNVDPESRALIRYALETEDPWLPELVRRTDAGEAIILDFSQSPAADDSSEEKLAVLSALAEMICRPGDEPFIKSAALLVLMAKLENAAHPKGLANAVKHLAFTHCGELNLCGMVDSQIAMLENKLLENRPLESEMPKRKSQESKLREGLPSDSFRSGSGAPPFRRDTRQFRNDTRQFRRDNCRARFRRDGLTNRILSAVSPRVKLE